MNLTDLQLFFIKAFFSIVSSFFFLFLYWKKLKDDYPYNQILSSGFYIIFISSLGTVVADNFLQDWWFYMTFAGAFLGFLLGIFRFKFRFFETLEAVILGSISVLGSFYLFILITEGDLFAAGGLLISIILFVTFIMFDRHYKKFTWYRSGRVGFSGLAVLGIYFLIRAAVAVFIGDMISFVQGKEVYISSILAFIAFLALFNLARRN